MMFTNPYSTMTGFKGVNSPSFLSTGTVSSKTITASSAITGYLEQLGSTTPLVATTAISIATAVPARGFSLITVANSSNPYLQIGAPKIGAEVELYAIVTATSHAKTILASTDGSIKFNSTCNAVTMYCSSDFVVLRGMTTAQWMAKVGGAAVLTTA